MGPIATDVSVVCLSVGRSVGLSVWNETFRYPAKTAGPIEMPFGIWGGLGHSNHVLDVDPDPSMERGNFGVGMGCPIVKYRELEPLARKNGWLD